MTAVVAPGSTLAGLRLERVLGRGGMGLVFLAREEALVADNGSSWYVTGTPDPRWSNDDLHTLGWVKGFDFEVVDASSIRPRC